MADDVDYGLAAKIKPVGTDIKPVDSDFTKTLSAYSNYNLSEAHAGLFRLEAQKQQMKLKGLSDYGSALDRGESPETAVRHIMRVDPEMGMKVLEGHQLGKTMRGRQQFSDTGDPNSLRINPQDYLTATEAERKQFDESADYFGRKAHAILGEADPKKRQALWREAADYGLKRGWLSQEMHKQYSDLPINSLGAQGVLNNIIRNYTDFTKFRESTGASSDATAAAGARYRTETSEPGQRIQYPAARPGSPVANAPPPGVVPITGQPGMAPIQGARPEELLVQPGPQQPSGPQANTTPAEGRHADENLPYYKEIKPLKVAPDVTSGPGVIEPGVHPIAAEATKHAMEALTKDIQPASNTAAKVKADLGNLRSELESGKVSTDRLAELKMTFAGYFYGAMRGVMGEEGAKNAALKAFGINLPWAEVFTKDATRMGLTFARQTEGAREAVMAIRIALGANPSMLNTAEGNLRVIDLLEKGADYDLERGKAATAYFRRQHNDTGTGHLIGFDQFMTGSHSPSQFMSQSIPYVIPRTQDGSVDKDKLQAGVTYEWAVRDPDTGKAAIDPKTKKPMTQRGKWDPEKGMIAVSQ